jgi:hypothetical protein
MFVEMGYLSTLNQYYSLLYLQPVPTTETDVGLRVEISMFEHDASKSFGRVKLHYSDSFHWV